MGWIAEEMKIANEFAIDAGIPLEPVVNLTPDQAADARYKYLAEKKFAKGNMCAGKPVVCDTAYCAMADIYFPDKHPIRRLAAYLPPGAG